LNVKPEQVATGLATAVAIAPRKWIIPEKELKREHDR